MGVKARLRRARFYTLLLRMSTVQEIEGAIEKLSEQEVAEIRAWLFEHDIARDAASGLLDDLANEAIDDLHAGRTKPL